MEILYSDRDLAVCVKPVGMDAEHELPEALEKALGGTVFPIHRLDKNVGGVTVYARTREAAARLSGTVREGTMVKEYLARVHGMPPEQGDWQDLLWKDRGKNKVYVVRRMRKGVKDARLEFRRVTQEPLPLVRIRLYTGRSHQIRVQFASRGFPLVGDHKYGARDEEKAPLLFSCRVSFPWKGETRVFEATPAWGALKRQYRLTKGKEGEDDGGAP